MNDRILETKTEELSEELLSQSRRVAAAAPASGSRPSATECSNGGLGTSPGVHPGDVAPLERVEVMAPKPVASSSARGACSSVSAGFDPLGYGHAFLGRGAGRH
jgi:hypothetical protein